MPRPDEQDPFSAAEIEAIRTGKPKRVYIGPSPKELNALYSDSHEASICPDCKRPHFDDHLGVRMGRCWGCYLGVAQPGKLKHYWACYDRMKGTPVQAPALTPLTSKPNPTPPSAKSRALFPGGNDERQSE